MEVWWWLFNLSYLSHVPERKILRSVKTFLCNKWVVTPKMVRNLIKRHQLSPAGIFVRVQTSVDCGTQHVAQFRYVTKSHHPPMYFLRLAGSISFFCYISGSALYCLQTSAGARGYLLEMRFRLFKITFSLSCSWYSWRVIDSRKLCKNTALITTQGYPYLTSLMLVFLIFETLQGIHLTLLKEKKMKVKSEMTKRDRILPDPY